MSAPPEGQFDELRKLLAWKRHEQPPPGYFPLFSARILERLEREQMSESCTWWERFVRQFDAKPVFACAYAIAVSGLLLIGFWVSQTFENELASSVPPAAGPWLATTPSPAASLPLTFINNVEPPTSAFGHFQSALRAETPNFFFPSHTATFHTVKFHPAQ